MIEVLLLEDHGAVREGLKLLIEKEPDMRVVEEAADVASAVGCDARPDVLVADLILPDARGPAAVSALSERFPDCGILIVTVVDSPVQVHLCLMAGAQGYILKEAAVPDLIRAIRRVNAGELVLDPSLGEGVRNVVKSASPESKGHIGYRLTLKELQLVRLLALGHTNSEAAAILNVSLRTIEGRRAGIMNKLGLKTRAELVRWTIEASIADSK